MYVSMFKGEIMSDVYSLSPSDGENGELDLDWSSNVTAQVPARAQEYKERTGTRQI